MFSPNKPITRWLFLAAALGSISAFASSSDPQPITVAQARPTVLITTPGGGAAPAAATAPAGARPMAVSGQCSSVNTGLIQMSKAMPPEVGFGETFTYEIRPAAVACVGNVVVTDTLPDGTSLVGTEPTANVSGNQLTWNLGNMDAGEAKVLKVTVKADKEGTLSSCATIKADPRVCAKTVVGRPQLAIEKTGPETAMQGDDVTYNIVVRNVGTAVAKAVTVTDKVPAGLGGPREIPFTVGDLAPGASKSIPVTLRASERGRHCNLAVAAAANAPSVQDDACTTVVKPGIRIVKTGTPEQFVGRQATYKITVTNIGDTDHANAVITDTAPPQTRIVSAPGANVSGNTATWTHALLKAGESKDFEIVLTSTQVGRWCNSAAVAVRGLRESAEACTDWKGVAGILVEFVDDPDPLQIGDSTQYTIRITNQGNVPINNINTAVESDTEIDPTASPEGKIAGKKVTFPTIQSLPGKQSRTFTFTGKAVSIGQAYQKVVVTADGFRAPIEELEVTTTY